MKRFILGLITALALAGTASAQVAVQGHYRSNGTYVAPHMRSSPNSTTSDNYSTRGNVNPYTGASGTRTPAPAYGAPAPRPSLYAPAPAPARRCTGLYC